MKTRTGTTRKRAKCDRCERPHYPGKLGVPSAPVMQQEEIDGELAGVFHRRMPKVFSAEEAQVTRSRYHEREGLRLLLAHYGLEPEQYRDLALQLARDNVPFFWPNDWEGHTEWNVTARRNLIALVDYQKETNGRSDAAACKWLRVDCNRIFGKDERTLQNELIAARKDDLATAKAAVKLTLWRKNRGSIFQLLDLPDPRANSSRKLRTKTM